MEKVLNSITVLNKTISSNTLSIALIILGSIFTIIFIIGIALDISGVLDVNVPSGIVVLLIGLALIFVGVLGVNKWWYNIDLYISLDNASIDEILEYFNMTDVTKYEGVITAHITPKSDYYNEFMVLESKFVPLV